ncbi:MoaD/ThiS family protein [Methanoplanus limicola]|uniref:Thiamine S protein n=1 Tax=Methanoplanus limicola DSM 2279 TaxID=937775 RepID=H1Z2S2_9EURY|nr:MoaD/ThiS family protein [Methanoplanus limicola]EHQ36475.1 thiamine S protein [Methanoplanus limicola DSM 2279]
MKLKIKFFARFAEIFPKETDFEYDGENTVYDALKMFCGKYPEGTESIFNQDGSFQDYVLIMHNFVRIDKDDVKAIQIVSGDEIAVYPPVAGG